MKITSVIKAVILASLFIIPMARISGVCATIYEQCPQYANKYEYKKTMEFFAYRLKDAVKTYGCEVIPIYSAFADEKSSDIIGIAESNPKIMHELITILSDNPGLESLIKSNAALVQSLVLAMNEKDDDYAALLHQLKNLNSQQLKLISQNKPAAAALALLIPNISYSFLNNNFSSKELETLLGMVSLCAINSAAIEDAGLPQLLPFFTTNPNDAAQTYKLVINTWGQNSIQELLLSNPGVLPALVPPLSSAELKDCLLPHWTPEQFHKMQVEYANLMRDVYKKAEREYGPAWAREICLAFVDSMIVALLTASPQEQKNIRDFLLAFVGNTDMFRRIILQSGCYPVNNINALGTALNNLGIQNQAVNNRTTPLTALANWHANGKLGNLLQDWVKTTDAKKLSIALNPEQSAQGSDAGYFIASLIPLAMYRDKLAPEQQKVMDHLLDVLPGAKQRPELAVTFLNQIKEPLFSTVRPGRFLNDMEVANHLVNYGYPESQDPSLYQHFLQNNALGFMPEAGDAIRERGSLPESQLLVHGQTFADRHWGYSVGDMVDAADIAVSVGAALTATIGTGGAASPTLVLAMGKVAAKKAARSMAQQVAKTMVRAVGKAPKFIRPVAGKAVRAAGEIIKKAAQKAPKTALIAKKGIEYGEKADGIWDGIRGARKLYTLLGGAGIAYEIGQKEIEDLCPGQKEQ